MLTIKNAAAQRTPVPLADLSLQFSQMREDVMQALLDVAESSGYVLGPRVASFEKAFAAYVGSKHCVGVNSGTSALHLALLGAGVGPGDEVITVPMTFIATSWGISYTGATPVFVDVDPVTYTMDVEQVERRITPKTRAILPVHLYGQPADMAALLDLGKRYGIPVIEDAAQAHGARYGDRGAGSLGLCGCFSFYPGKNLGAYGEAGAVVTDDDAIAARLRSLRDHAQGQRYHHDEIGFNYRMDAFQGAVLGIKLRYLEALDGGTQPAGPALPGRTRRLALAAADQRPGSPSRLASVRGPAPGTGPHPRRSGSARHSDRAALPDPAALAEGLSSPGLQRRRLSGGGARRPRVPDAAAVPGDDGSTANRGY